MGREQSYIYVIGPGDPWKRAEWVKVGRSAVPATRRSQLQVGQGSKLKVYGAYQVAAADAPRLEAATQAALAAFHVKGEVFQVAPELACAFAEHIAKHGEPDEFLRTALARELAEREWMRLKQLPEASGRWREAETVAAMEAAKVEMRRLEDAMFDLDFERGCKVDEISGQLRGAVAVVTNNKRLLRPRQPRRSL